MRVFVVVVVVAVVRGDTGIRRHLADHLDHNVGNSTTTIVRVRCVRAAGSNRTQVGEHGEHRSR